MKQMKLKFIIESDATFGKGDGVAGYIDSEIQHDKYGLPFLGGRTLKGVIEEECANILYSLELQGKKDIFLPSAARLFGVPGSRNEDKAIMSISDAILPKDVRSIIIKKVKEGKLRYQQVLDSLCSIRQQTSIDPETGAPKKGALRSSRVILRETPFESELSFIADISPEDKGLLGACLKAVRRAGLDRNRGKGRIKYCSLVDENGNDVSDLYFNEFLRVVSE
ncbi:RAMP superfamily CRISPR-associated protein [Methanosalsum natronophilum]|uniref:RAMP superfamily CRISPR-associated protein n=1 Tax=Methanosalsum natronophilum TaxID=768733 RepID=UPI00216A918E|nr:RAMP superfamily CRISPR-associated protein [Methanosalsum natronophilum]MCS3924844.1 hypothetical protein [Methanosalsum natronophilum]